MSITDSSTLWQHVAQRSDNSVHECKSCVCVAHWYRPNTHNRPTCHLFDKQCRMPIISGTVIWKAQIYSQLATGCRHAFQYTHCLICTLPNSSSCFKPTTTTAAVGGELLGWPILQFPCPMPASCPVNRGVLIAKVWFASVPRRSTKDTRPQTLTICNLESEVRPHLNAEC